MIDKMSTPLESRLRLGGRPSRRAHSLTPRQRRGEMVAAIIGLLWLCADLTGVAGIGEQLPTEFSQLTRSDPPQVSLPTRFAHALPARTLGQTL